MRRFGLDYEALSRDHPGLIYASISGYGQTGPVGVEGRLRSRRAGRLRPDVDHRRARRPAGEGGCAADRPRRRHCSRCRGSWRRSIYRARTGRGQYIDTSLVEAGVALSVWEATEYFSGAGIPQPMGSAHRMSAPYQAVRCADGYITLAAANDRLFVRLCELLNRPEWPRDPEYADDTARVRNKAKLAAAIESVTIDQTAAALARPASTRTASRAGRSTTTRRCSPIRRSRAREMVGGDRAPDARPDAHARLADQDVGDAAAGRPPGAAARRAHRRSAARGRTQRRRDRGTNGTRERS